MRSPDFVQPRSLLDRLFVPVWAGAWLYTRLLWSLAALLEYGWRVFAISDAYAAQDMVFTSNLYQVAAYVNITPPIGYALWAGSILGILMVAWGGRGMRVGLLLWAVCAWTLMANEALNVKAHDRLIAWVAVGLFLSPAGERDLHRKYRSPFARYFLLIAFCGIYGSTGLCKHLHEPSWWTSGEVLAYHLLNHWHGSSAFAVWLSDKLWMIWPMTIMTVVWEVGFMFGIWFKRLNPWMLLIGMFFHGMLLLTMQVGPFAFVAFSAYPVLLHPELAREGFTRLRTWVSSRRAARVAHPA